MSHRLRTVLALGLVAVAPLAVAACGGDDDGGDVRQQVIDKITDGDDAPTGEQAGCMADGLIASLGEKRVKELLEVPDGSDIEDVLSSDEQAKFASAAVACIDARSMVRDQLVGSGFSEADADCVLDAIGEDELDAMIESSMTGGEPSEDVLTDAILACGLAL